MKLKPPIKLAWLRFTSCSGCQLTLVNCEGSLAELSEFVELQKFPLVSSAVDNDNLVDVALVEGSLTTPGELARLLAIRRKAGLLIAVGACALTGGVNSMVKSERLTAIDAVYGQVGMEWDTFPPQPVHHFVRVDGQIPGCPPERRDLLQSITAILHGGLPGSQVMPVCMECRINESRCLLQEDQLPCLGPITRAGCNALCPGLGVACEGCRGLVQEANQDELRQLLFTAGLSEQTIRDRLERFGETT